MLLDLFDPKPRDLGISRLSRVAARKRAPTVDFFEGNSIYLQSWRPCAAGERHAAGDPVRARDRKIGSRRRPSATSGTMQLPALIWRRLLQCAAHRLYRIDGRKIARAIVEPQPSGQLSGNGNVARA